MIIPRSDSSSWAVLNALYEHGPMTLLQGVSKHGILNTYLGNTRKIYERCVDAGWVFEIDEVYSLTPNMRNVIMGREEKPKKELLPVVPPRVVNRFTKPMDPSKLPSAKGRREGSDWSHVASYYGRVGA